MQLFFFHFKFCLQHCSQTIAIKFVEVTIFAGEKFVIVMYGDCC